MKYKLKKWWYYHKITKNYVLFFIHLIFQQYKWSVYHVISNSLKIKTIDSSPLEHNKRKS